MAPDFRSQGFQACCRVIPASNATHKDSVCKIHNFTPLDVLLKSEKNILLPEFEASVLLFGTRTRRGMCEGIRCQVGADARWGVRTRYRGAGTKTSGGRWAGEGRDVYKTTGGSAGGRGGR